MLAPWLDGELQTVPDLVVFSSVDEMSRDLAAVAEQYPDLTRLRRVGTSRLGDPLTCLTVDCPGSDRDALVFGLPHPNEPIGGLTALHLARRVCEDAELRARLGLRWHIVACIDPDGLRLNEGWLKGPFTREHYSRNFYRPAGHDQVEWTFPFAYKSAYFDAVLPETLALMRLIDETRPELMCSLHNSELGGVYYYLSRPQPALHPVLQEIPSRLGLALDRGEPEAPWLERFADGIFRMLDLESAYDHLEETGGETPAGFGGTTSDSYARKYGTLTLMCELPFWTDDSASDDSPSTVLYADALRAQSASLGELVQVLDDVLADAGDDLTPRSPFVRASRYFVEALRGSPRSVAERAAAPEAQRKATVAEVASQRDTVHSFRLRYAGMLLRALDGEIQLGNCTPAVRRQRASLADRYAGWCTEAEAATSSDPIPIRSLVATQYAALVATADHLATERC